MYVFEDFKEDYDAIAPALHADGVEEAMFFTLKMMRERHEEKLGILETKYRTQVFLMVMSYISRHIQDFDQGDFAVTATKSALVGFHLMKAVHQIYAVEKPIQVKEPDPKTVMEIAAQFPDD